MESWQGANHSVLAQMTFRHNLWSCPYKDYPLLLAWCWFLFLFKAPERTSSLSIPTAVSGEAVQKEFLLEEGYGQLLVSHLAQQDPCCVHNLEEFLQYNEKTWETVLIITTSITQDISNQRVKLDWIRCQLCLSETLENLSEGWDVFQLKGNIRKYQIHPSRWVPKPSSMGPHLGTNWVSIWNSDRF